MKIDDGINGIWAYNDIPEPGEFVLIADGPHQDNAEEAERSTDKDRLIKLGNRMKSNLYSSLRIYNDQLKIVWDAFLPSTLPPNKGDYDPEYFKSVSNEVSG